jgi:hypothetical protein
VPLFCGNRPCGLSGPPRRRSPRRSPSRSPRRNNANNNNLYR